MLERCSERFEDCHQLSSRYLPSKRVQASGRRHAASVSSFNRMWRRATSAADEIQGGHKLQPVAACVQAQPSGSRPKDSVKRPRVKVPRLGRSFVLSLGPRSSEDLWTSPKDLRPHLWKGGEQVEVAVPVLIPVPGT